MLFIVMIIGATSLYGLLSLFQRFLPTSEAFEATKLARVAARPVGVSERIAIDVGQSAYALQERQGARVRDSRVPLAKMLAYATWRISPIGFYLAAVALSLVLLVLAYPYLDAFMLPLVALAGPVTLRSTLNRCIERRANRFGDDYPQFLMTTVGLLKTGMTPSGALEAAAAGLERHSLVRREVFLMLERIKVGVPEDKSIGSFAESIYHPEIELFVQSLLLGVRVGGSLADSLERLSKQVRKRQYFKSSAVASLAQQRGSMIAIVLIMLGLVMCIVVMMPKLVVATYTNPMGWKVIQASVAAIIIAVMWLQGITRIKI